MTKPKPTMIDPAKVQLIGSPVGDTGKTLFLGTALLCDLEEEFGMPFRQILEQVANDVDVRTIRVCTQKGLFKHHADEATPAHVDALLDDAGLATVAAAIVAEFNFVTGGAAQRAKA